MRSTDILRLLTDEDVSHGLAAQIVDAGRTPMRIVAEVSQVLLARVI